MDQTRILNIFEQIPNQLAKDNKKFQIPKVASGARFKDYRGCIEWLRDAGIVQICYCLNSPDLPLKGNYDDSKFKLYTIQCTNVKNAMGVRERKTVGVREQKTDMVDLTISQKQKLIFGKQ